MTVSITSEQTAPILHPTPAFDAEKDCTGLRCPMPLLQTKLGLKSLIQGQVLRVSVTDQAYLQDLNFLLDHKHCQLLAQTRATPVPGQAEVISVYLQKC